MRLVDNWRQAWKWYSVHIMIAIVALPEIWGYFPPEWKESLPPNFLAIAMSVLGGSAIVARVFSQESKDGKPGKRRRK